MGNKTTLKCKLLKDGKVIDDDVKASFNLRKETKSPILDAWGEIETSKPIPIETEFDLNVVQFELFFEGVFKGSLEKVPIVFTDIDWKEKKWAYYEAKHVR